MYNRRLGSSLNEESSDDGEDESDEENSGSASSSSSSESENEIEKFLRKAKLPEKENPVMVPDSGKPYCKLCPDWFNDYATEEKIFIYWSDIEIHHKIWHNSKYMPDKCHICCFRAENLTELKNQHDNFPKLCKILQQNKTYIRLEEHLDGGGSGRRGRKSRNASGISNDSFESRPTILKPSSISPKLPKPSMSKSAKKPKKPNTTSEINIRTFDLTSSPSPDRPPSSRPSPSNQSLQHLTESPSSVSSSLSTISHNLSKNSTPKSSGKPSQPPSPLETNGSAEKKSSSPNNLKMQTPEGSNSKDERYSPKPESTRLWTYEDKIDVNEAEEGEAEFTCDECNINEISCGKFKKLQLEIHQKLWHSNYAFSECPKCKQRFETITDMKNSTEHQSNCAAFQAGNVMVSVNKVLIYLRLRVWKRIFHLFLSPAW